MKVTDRAPVCDDHTIFDVDVHIAVRNLYTVDHLADIDMCDTGVGVCIGVLANLVRERLRKLAHKDVPDESICDLHWINSRIHWQKPVRLNLIGIGIKDGVGVLWTETQRLAQLCGAVVLCSMTEGIARKPCDEGRDEETTHLDERLKIFPCNGNGVRLELVVVIIWGVSIRSPRPWLFRSCAESIKSVAMWSCLVVDSRHDTNSSQFLEIMITTPGSSSASVCISRKLYLMSPVYLEILIETNWV